MVTQSEAEDMQELQDTCLFLFCFGEVGVLISGCCQQIEERSPIYVAKAVTGPRDSLERGDRAKRLVKRQRYSLEHTDLVKTATSLGVVNLRWMGECDEVAIT
jgi:hypothetical protein